MNTDTKESSVRLTIEIAAPIERAFRVFTEQFDRIKPREHNLLAVKIAETVFEPRVGGHIYDRGIDGSVCRWARVLAYEPPSRIVFSWDISPKWQIEEDLNRSSEVEIHFIAEESGKTRIELEHRNLDHHGDGWKEERESVRNENGWPIYLKRFSDLIEEQREMVE